MAHFAHLTGCPDRGAAQRYDFKALWAAPGPELTARFSIPLFWLAGFDREDEVLTRWPPDASADDASALMVLCASGRDFTTRLERRRSAILALLPPAMALYYDEWLRFVRMRYTQHLLLRTEDLFAMQGFDETAERLRHALDALQPADAGDAIRDTGDVEWFVGCDALFAERQHGETAENAAARWRAALAGSAYTEQGRLLWPTRPQQPEIDLAAGLPAAEAPAAPASDAASDQALTTLIRSGRRPSDVQGRMQLAFDKLTGTAPLGVDAPNKTARKIIGGGGVLLDVLRNAVFGLLSSLMGATVLYLGIRKDFDVRMVGLGALLLGIGLYCDWLFVRSLRRFRAILKA